MTHIAKKITRWRLSPHRLYIETGRYKTPPIPENVELVRFAIPRKMNTMPYLYAPHHTGIYEKNIIRY